MSFCVLCHFLLFQGVLRTRYPFISFQSSQAIFSYCETYIGRDFQSGIFRIPVPTSPLRIGIGGTCMMLKLDCFFWWMRVGVKGARIEDLGGP